MHSPVQRYLKQQRAFASVREELFLALQIAADRLMEPWAVHLRQRADLTPVQYNVLRILRGAGPPGLLAGEIGERMITRSPDVTRIIDRLEHRRLVRRVACPEDGRAVRVHITAAGRALIAPLDREGAKLMREHLRHVPEAKLIALRDHVADLLSALDSAV